jgi:folylpolyglutamate synthase/dihydropteroate synthase
MVVIFGCCADKDVAGMLERITSGADKVIFTKVDNVRSADPNELAARYIEAYGKMAQVPRRWRTRWRSPTGRSPRRT